MPSPQIRIVLAAYDRFINDLIKKLALDIVANLVRAPNEGGTPVKTGWARANWIPKIGTPVTRPSGSPTSVSGAAQQTGVAEIAATYHFKKGAIYISNNVPYILKLNEGSSKQAAKGFIQANVVEALKMIG